VVGSTPPGSTVEQHAVLTDARRQLAAVDAEAAEVARRVTAARSAFAGAEEGRSAVVAELRAATVARDERAAQLRRLEAEAAAYRRELEAVAQAAEQLDREVAARGSDLAALEAAAHPEDGAGLDDDGADIAAERLVDVLRAAQDHEVDARVALSAAISRRDEIARRIAVAEREAVELERAWVAADERQERRRVAVERCRALAEVADHALRAGTGALEASAVERASIEARRDGQQEARVLTVADFAPSDALVGPSASTPKTAGGRRLETALQQMRPAAVALYYA
jgi:chromosome segregation ATPase